MQGFNMSKNRISEIIITNFGQEIYERALTIPKKDIKILAINEKPLEIRCIIFEKDSIYHVIIDEKNEIFYHDCQSILFKQTSTVENICLHIVAIFLIIDINLTIAFINNYRNYIPLKSFSRIFEEKLNNLSLLMKDSISSGEINLMRNLSLKYHRKLKKDYLRFTLNYFLKRGYYLELFRQLKHIVKGKNRSYFNSVSVFIEKSFSQLDSEIPNLTFLRIIRTLNSFEEFFIKISPELQIPYCKKIVSKINLKNSNTCFEKKYFYYFIVKWFSSTLPLDEIISKESELIEYSGFLDGLMDYIAKEDYSSYKMQDISILKKHLDMFHIPKDFYEIKIKDISNYILDFEIFFFLRKFAYLKLLIKINKIQRHKFQFKQENNTFIVQHHPDNIKNQFYFDYLLPHLGFYGENRNLIKSRDIGENYYIMDRIFQIEWDKNPSIAYFKKKMWDNVPLYQIKSNEGLTLLRYGVDYIKDSGQEFTDINEILIIEWDLTNKPVLGSIIVAYDEGCVIIPDSENPLFYDIKPFDLCYCKSRPKESNKMCRIVEPISKCSFKDALESVSKGMQFIEGFYPLSLLKKVLNKEINPFKAIELLKDNKKINYVPHFHQFVYEFEEFLFNIVLKEDSFLFNRIEGISSRHLAKIFSILKLDTLFSGIDISLDFFASILITSNTTSDSLREKTINTLHQFIRTIINKKEIGSTKIFDLTQMRNTPFSIYSQEILNVRKEEFEKSIILQNKDMNPSEYDISEISLTFYGAKILEALNIRNEIKIDEVFFERFKEMANQLGLSINKTTKTIKK